MSAEDGVLAVVLCTRVFRAELASVKVPEKFWNAPDRLQWTHICVQGHVDCDCAHLRWKTQIQHGSCLRCSADQYFASLTPTEAVKLLYKSEEDFVAPILHLVPEAQRVHMVSNGGHGIAPIVPWVVTACIKDPRYRRAGAADAFVWYLQKLRALDKGENRSQWMYAVAGLANIAVACFRDETEEQDSGIIDTILSAYWDILEVIDDEGRLWDKNHQYDIHRIIACKFICLAAVANSELKWQMYESKTLGIIMRCWTYSGMYKKEFIRDPIKDAIQLFLRTTEDANGGYPPSDHINRIFEVTDIPAFVSKSKAMLKRKAVLYEELLTYKFFLHICEEPPPHPFGKIVIREGLHRLFISALDRQLQAQSMHSTHQIETGFLRALFLDYDYFDDPNSTDLLVDVVSTTPIFNLLATHLRELVDEGEIIFDMDTFYRKFISRLFHALALPCECKSWKPPADCQYPRLPADKIPAFFATTKAALGRVAFPTLLYLQKNDSYAESEPISEFMPWMKISSPLWYWWKLMGVFNLTQEDAREQYRANRTCCFDMCPSRLEFKKPAKHSKCAACQVTYYCGSVCQKKDWPIHRMECKILQASQGA